MKTHFTNLMGIVLLLGLTMQACTSATATLTAITLPPTNPPPPANTQPAPTAEQPTSTSTPPPLPTSTPQPTVIQHVTKPGDPSYISSQTTNDCMLGNTTGTNLTVVIPSTCDNTALDFIERPVVAGSNTYLPYLDIGKVQLGGNRDWIFARINVYNAIKPTVSGDIYYFFKLDLNMDGRNSNVVLLSVKNLPLDTVLWTVDGVQAWTNVDGKLSMVFDAGEGADADLAWARRSPNTIEIALKQAFFNGPSRFAWTAWAYQGTLTPPDFALSNEPLDLYQIDNTCAWGYNVNAYGLINHCFR